MQVTTSEHVDTRHLDARSVLVLNEALDALLQERVEVDLQSKLNRESSLRTHPSFVVADRFRDDFPLAIRIIIAARGSSVRGSRACNTGCRVNIVSAYR